MVGKEILGRASPLFLVFLVLGFGFGTYNMFTMLFHYQNWSDGRFVGSGSSDPDILRDMERLKLRYHVALTATDASYNKWQSRIMYFWYKRIKDAPGSDMGGFTRILHSGKPDDLMDEIPTFVVDPLPKGLDRGYVVLNRPWAFVQWLEEAAIEEEYILMAEPDHIFVNPLPNLAHGDYPVAFPFGYISPSTNKKIIRKYYPEEKGPVTNIDPIGNSPSIIKKTLLRKIAPTWMNVSLRMKHDRETDLAFGWVLEMYGYAVASALHDVRHILRKDFMAQPPFDREVDKKFLLHYTYSCDYTKEGKLIYKQTGDWRFNKRFHQFRPIPRNLSFPPPGAPESVDIRTGEIIGHGTERHGLYFVDNVALQGQSNLATRTFNLQVWLWHCRLGHPSFSYLKRLFPTLFNSETNSLTCDTCLRAKQTRAFVFRQ